jgi:hypothetical protein
MSFIVDHGILSLTERGACWVVSSRLKSKAENAVAVNDYWPKPLTATASTNRLTVT